MRITGYASGEFHLGKLFPSVIHPPLKFPRAYLRSRSEDGASGQLIIQAACREVQWALGQERNTNERQSKESVGSGVLPEHFAELGRSV